MEILIFEKLFLGGAEWEGMNGLEDKSEKSDLQPAN